MMNHQWQQNKDFEPHDGYYKELKCKRCGMIKTLHVMTVKGKKFFGAYFVRSGISFGFQDMSSYIPECLDWNDNTLD